MVSAILSAEWNQCYKIGKSKSSIIMFGGGAMGLWDCLRSVLSYLICMIEVQKENIQVIKAPLSKRNTTFGMKSYEYM